MDSAPHTNESALTRRQVCTGLALASTGIAVPVEAMVKYGSQQMNNEADNISIVRRQYDLVSAGRIEDAAALFSDPTRNHGREVPRRAVLAILQDIKTTFPDWSFTIQDIVAQGHTVAVRCRFRGTHEGTGQLPVNGGLMIGVPPTHKQMDVQHIHWFVVKEGLIAEHWASRDDIAMMQQLGLLPETKFDFSKLAAPPPR